MRIGFYINPVAKLRARNSLGDPEPAVIAAIAEATGAQVIIAGWSSPKGLLKERDIVILREVVQGDFIIALPVDSDLVDNVISFHPEGVVLLGHGWDGDGWSNPVQPEIDISNITSIVDTYRSSGISTSMFLDPDPATMKAARRCGAEGAVINCGAYASARTDEEAQEALDKISDAALAANKFGMVAIAANGLNYRNIGPIVSLRYIEEVYVGRAVVTKALFTGMNQAISDLVSTVYYNNIEG